MLCLAHQQHLENMLGIFASESDVGGAQRGLLDVQQLKEVLHTNMAAMKKDILALVGSSLVHVIAYCLCVQGGLVEAMVPPYPHTLTLRLWKYRRLTEHRAGRRWQWHTSQLHERWKGTISDACTSW